jgi:hypothetical protein
VMTSTYPTGTFSSVASLKSSEWENWNHLFADLFFYSCEAVFIQWIFKKNKKNSFSDLLISRSAI